MCETFAKKDLLSSSRRQTACNFLVNRTDDDLKGSADEIVVNLNVHFVSKDLLCSTTEIYWSSDTQ